MSTNQIVTLSIPAIELEHRQYQEKIRRLQAQVQELQAKSEILEQVLLYVRPLVPQEHANGFVDSGARSSSSRSEPARVGSLPQSESPQTKKHIDQYIRANEQFKAADLIEWILKVSPTAKTNSIQGELSRTVKRGDVVIMSRGEYKSMVYKKPDDGIDQAIAQPSPAPVTNADWHDEEDDFLDPFAKADTPFATVQNASVESNEVDDFNDPFAE